MDIPDSISMGIIANIAYDLLKRSVKITFEALKDALNRPSWNAEEESAVKALVPLLEKIPEAYRTSPESIQQYLNERTSSARPMQVASGEGAVFINGDIRGTAINIGGVHQPASPEKKNT